MAYYPKNRIITDLYTNGDEYVIKGTGESYVGYYYSLYNGTFFTGKNQNDGVPREIIKAEISPIEIASNPLYVTITTQNDLLADDYLRVLGKSPVDRKLPTPYYPQPTQQDYELGEFQRYFAKQINDYVFIEINKDTYDNLVQNSSDYYWELYYALTIPWELIGEKEKVARTNKIVVEQVEAKYKAFGFSRYIELSGGYLNFYPKLGTLNSGSYINDTNQGYVLDYRNRRIDGLFSPQDDTRGIRRDNSVSR
jgi:hypothetical protein